MKLLLFDGNSIINRAFYGIRPLTNSEGLNTNAIYGFLNIYLKAVREEEPDAVMVAFDLRAPTFRHGMFGGYKAARKGMPDELAEQLPVLKELLSAMGVPLCEKEGYEADDLIGTVSSLIDPENDACVIYTGDRDSFQLISPAVSVKLAVPRRGQSEEVFYDVAKIREVYGIEPARIVDLKAIAGDPSDNIPGVPGIGEKGALCLIAKYGGIREIYEKIDCLDERESLLVKLREGRESAFLSYKLAKINRKVPIDGSCAADFSLLDMDKKKVRRLLERLEFSSFLKKFALDGPEEKEPVLIKDAGSYAGDASGLLNALKKEGHACYLLKEGSIEIGTDGESLFLSAAERDAEYGAFLKAFFEDEGIQKTGLDLKSDFVALQKSGIAARGFSFDLSIGAYLCDPAMKSYDLAALGEKYLDASERALPATRQMLLLTEKIRSELEKCGMEALYRDLEFPLIFVLAEMELYGFHVDKEKLLSFGEELKAELLRLEAQIFALAGGEFNINSPKQLGVVLFEKLGLPAVKKTKTGYSTDAAVLEELAPWHEIVGLIKDYRQVSKLISTYVEGLSQAINKEGGRIHSSFNQTVTQTGRISSAEPNLQNIPVRTPLGREMRKVFTAEKGNVLVDADYSQIELRVLAHIANDETMLEAFKNGEDIHAVTASQVFASGGEATAEMRSKAKAVNFGIVYGIGDFSLAKDLKVSRKQARNYIDGYLEKYSGVRKYMEETVRLAKEQGFVTTILNRRRYIPEIKAKNFTTRSFGERVAMNTPIQGSAADIIKIAMVGVSRRLKSEGLKARLILQVHDELIVECPPEEADLVRTVLKDEMEGAVQLKVPLQVDISQGETWYDAKG